MNGLPWIIVLLGSVATAIPQATIPPEDWWADIKGIKNGAMLKGSESPNGKFALFEYHFLPPDETKSRIGLAPVDRSKLLFNIDSATKWDTDREVLTFLSFAWNQESDLVAAHSALPRHSRLRLYAIRDDGAVELKVPDLLSIACKRLGIKRSTVVSSGQLPAKWLQRDFLEVTVRLKTSKGTRSIPIKVSIGDDDRVSANGAKAKKAPN